MREACVTPNSSRGTCIEVRDCTPLLNLLQAKPLSQANLEYLRKSQCGFHDRQPLVCCPRQNPAPKPPNVEVVEDVSRHRNLPLLRNDLCGPLSDDRIIGGNITKINELPWMALIAYSGSKGNASPFRCGGTVINDFYILTAGHCVKFLKSGIRPQLTSVPLFTSIYVRLGEHDLDSRIDCEEDQIYGTKTCAPEPQDIPIAQAVAHPQYTGKSDLRNDIALIRLTRQINFTPDSVRPVCLPIGLSVQEQNLVGKKLTVAGWGVTENRTSSRVLLKVDVPVKSHAECAQVYKNQVQISKTSQLCAGGVRNGGDSCNGDSGGPLTYYGPVEGSVRAIQHGVVSFGPRACGTTGLPGVYTRVGYYMKWILDNIRP
ncbi:hypothetical protein J437_LFUL016745 [Ladona fulva]|uniref:CLIP domain-containing serine protease n=1 Tax=Ladona fulva TaxID=123851 RepID=A0A8K0PAE0_LADFU|nr:hypothetical protein J437_LFUL016745 [Ladona fulva]